MSMFKGKYRILFFAIILLTLWASPVFATNLIELAFDGIALPVCASRTVPYYTDTQAEIKQGSTFVPVRVISEILGADVSWQGGAVIIQQNGTILKVTLGQKVFELNQKNGELAVAPYIKNGHVMVPIRLVADALGCRVDYYDGVVNVHSRPMRLQNNNVMSIAKDIHMTSEVNRYEIDAPLVAKNMYVTVVNQHNGEIEEPKYYGRNNIADYPYFYSQKAEYYLLNDAKKPIKKFEIYELSINDFNATLQDGYANYLIYIDNKWYSLSDASYNLMEAWGSIARWDFLD